MPEFWVRLGRVVAASSLLLLAGCIHTADDIEAPAQPCVAPAEDSSPEATADLFFVTSRAGDCGVNPIRFGRLRATETGYGYFAGRSPVLLNADTWMTRLRGNLPAGRPGRVLIYVHGYYNSFGEATARARDIGELAAFDGPVIAFSWPSHARLSRYHWDEENALWAQPYFDELLLRLLAEPRIGEIVLVGHSMGNRILLRSLPAIEHAEPDLATAKIRNVVLASPDVDRAIFERDYMSRLGRAGRRTTIYVSRVDRPLRASWRMHAYVRVGDSGCDFADVLRDRDRRRCFLSSLPPNIAVVETSLVRGRLIGHADFVESDIARLDLCRVLNGHQAYPERAPADPGRANVYFLTRPAREPGCGPPVRR